MRPSGLSVHCLVDAGWSRSAPIWAFNITSRHWANSCPSGLLCSTIPDVSLTDENTGMMDTLCKSKFEDLGLKTPLQEVFYSQAQHKIELHFGFIKHTNSYQSSQQGITCLKWKWFGLQEKYFTTCAVNIIYVFSFPNLHFVQLWSVWPKSFSVQAWRLPNPVTSWQ